MFHVDWSAVATDGVLKAVRAAAGAGESPDDATLRPLVATILAHTGGLPVAATDWNAAHCEAVARTLLHEAVGALLRRGYGRARRLPSCDLSKADEGGALGLDRTLVARPRVDVNTADAETLERLPVLGPALARRTVDERRARGPFASAAELADRVDGVGEAGADRLALMLHFDRGDRPAAAAPAGVFDGEFEADLALLVALHPGDGAGDRLLATLEAMAAFCAATPHPATRTGRIRSDLEAGEREASDRALPDRVAVDQVEVLEDEAYYERLLGLLETARKRVDVAMFFIAAPGPRHPSQRLLERLAKAHQAGAAVRVLVDRDREEDPYGSRLINAGAIAVLTESGVPVRVDAEDQLLHSKFVAIDQRLAVIGSHNWTAGSFFRYRDTSVAIAGEAFASALHARFDRLWEAGEQP